MYPYNSPYYMDYAYTAPPAGGYTAACRAGRCPANEANAANPPSAEPPDGSTGPAAGQEQSEYYTACLTAFAEGDYPNATLTGGPRGGDNRDPKVHTMLMLGMFAMHEYRGAAMGAHAVAGAGPIPDWPTLYGVYGKVEPYTEQLRALEKFTRKKPEAAEGRFLLGFQYLMAGHRDSAKGEFLKALTLTPKGLACGQVADEIGWDNSAGNCQAVAAGAGRPKGTPERSAAPARARTDPAGEIARGVVSCRWSVVSGERHGAI